MIVDTIILSNTVSEEHFKLLSDTVSSLHNSEEKIKFNVIVVESNKKIHEHLKERIKQINCEFVIPKQKFNYNLFFNIGLRRCKSEYVLFSNSDVIYSKNWFSEIRNQFIKDPELSCACPTDRRWHRHDVSIFPDNQDAYYGYRTSYEFTGWCFVVKRQIFDIIGSFDERFEFYYQDNDFINVLEQYNLKNALVIKSEIHHLLSKSHNTIKAEDIKLCSMQYQHEIYQQKWNTTNDKRYKRLSILICTLPERKHFLERVMHRLKPQLTNEIEVLISDENKDVPIGKKRNDLMNKAIGEYICFIDDDDWVSEKYIEKILKATDYKPDVIGFNSIITIDQQTPRRVEITLNHDNWDHKMGKINGEDHPVVYYRCPNHLSPVKRKIALNINFPEISNQEDKFYSLSLQNFCREEIYINEYMYYYDCRDDKASPYSQTSTEELVEFMETNESIFAEQATEYFNQKDQ